MRIKDLEPILPRYSDNSGFDCQIIYKDDKHPLFLCRSELYRPNENPKQRELEVIGLQSGILRCGGHFDEDLVLIVKEEIK